MDVQTPKRDASPLRWWIWLTYAVLFAVSIPWYWPADDKTLWLGMPAWATVAVIGSGTMSVFTALLVWRCWPAPEGNADEDVPA